MCRHAVQTITCMVCIHNGVIQRVCGGANITASSWILNVCNQPQAFAAKLNFTNILFHWPFGGLSHFHFNQRRTSRYGYVHFRFDSVARIRRGYQFLARVRWQWNQLECGANMYSHLFWLWENEAIRLPQWHIMRAEHNTQQSECVQGNNTRLSIYWCWRGGLPFGEYPLDVQFYHSSISPFILVIFQFS